MRIRTRRRGQALAELALSLPLLIGVMTLVIEGTLVVSARQTLTDAVHQVTRFAAGERPEAEEVRTRLMDMLAGTRALDPGELRVQVRYGIDSQGGENLTVSAEIPVRPFAFTRIGTFRLQADSTYRLPKRTTSPKS